MSVAEQPPNLGRRQLLDLFGEVDQLLTGAVTHELLVVGGAALAMRWEDRLSADVDVVDVPIPPELQEAIRTVAARHDLAAGWLNHSAAGFAPNMQADDAVVYRGARLVVRVAGADYLLAMKLRASRPDDLRDAVQLAAETGRTTRESLYELISEGYWRGTVIEGLDAFVTAVLAALSENDPRVEPFADPSPGEVGGDIDI